jgi:hypothetical protein
MNTALLYKDRVQKTRNVRQTHVPKKRIASNASAASSSKAKGTTVHKTQRAMNSSAVSQYILVFSLVTGVTFFFCSLVGQTLMEKSRRECLRALERTKEMRMSVAFLRNQVDKHDDLSHVDRWALSHGFVSNSTNQNSILASRNSEAGYRMALHQSNKPKLEMSNHGSVKE